MNTLTLRKFALILGVAFASHLATPEAHAGNSEIIAIGNKLGTTLVGTTSEKVAAARARIQAATDTALSTAVRQAYVDTANSKLSPAVIAGEALKGAVTATNIGTQLATDLLLDLANPTLATVGLYPKITANVQKFVGTSSKTAATSTGANPAQIPTYAAGFIARAGIDVINRNAEAIAIASFASGSPTAIGAIIGGRTLNGDAEVTGDVKLVGLANQAINSKKLTSSAQQIAQYVGDAATLAPQFTVALLISTNSANSANTRFTTKIATGVTTSNPTVASEILSAMFQNDNTSGTVFLATVKNVSTLAKNLGLVSDAEEVSQVAAEFGARVGMLNPSTGKVVGIAQSKINTIAKGLVAGLATRATGTGIDNLLRNSRTNRIDEIGEVGAYLFNAIKALPVFANTSTKSSIKQAPSIITGLIKTIISASLKVHRDIASVPPTSAKATTTKDGLFQATVADDVAGSVAQTIRVLGPTAFGAAGPGLVSIYDAILAALTKPTAGTSIAGKSKTTYDIDQSGPLPAMTISQLVQTALASGLNDTNNASIIYEDGTQPLLAQGPVGLITEPETDIRSR